MFALIFCSVSSLAADRTATEEVLAADRLLSHAVVSRDTELFRSLVENGDGTQESESVEHPNRPFDELWTAVLAANRTIELSWRPRFAEVAHRGDLAYSTGDYSMIKRAPSGESQTSDGTYVTIWRKDETGQWRARLDLGTPLSGREPTAPYPETPSTSETSATVAAADLKSTVEPVTVEAPAETSSAEAPAETSGADDSSPPTTEASQPAPLVRKRRCHTLDSLDENNDLKIDFQDRYWRYIYVWQDQDRNGAESETELISAYEAGIRSIDLDLASFGRTKGAGAMRVTDRIELDIGVDGFGDANDGVLVLDATRLGRGSGPDLLQPDGTEAVGLTVIRGGMSLRTESETIEFDCPAPP